MFELVDILLDGVSGDILPELIILLRVVVVDIFIQMMCSLMYVFSRIR